MPLYLDNLSFRLFWNSEASNSLRHDRDKVAQKQMCYSNISLISNSLHFLDVTLLVFPILIECDFSRFRLSGSLAFFRFHIPDRGVNGWKCKQYHEPFRFPQSLIGLQLLRSALRASKAIFLTYYDMLLTHILVFLFLFTAAAFIRTVSTSFCRNFERLLED